VDKRDLVNAVSVASDLPRSVVNRVIKETMDSVVFAVAAGESVRLSGFGTFEIQRRAPRTARNPRTNQQLVVPEKNIPRFRPSPVFKDAVSDTG